MELSKELIREIAESLECGMIPYFNKNSYEVKTMFDLDRFDIEMELIQEDLDEIERNWADYIKVEGFSSREDFQIMTEFAENVMNVEIRGRLIYALNRNKPFQNFKYEINFDESLKQQWFKFKASKYRDWVKSFFENVDQ